MLRRDSRRGCRLCSNTVLWVIIAVWMILAVMWLLIVLGDPIAAETVVPVTVRIKWDPDDKNEKLPDGGKKALRGKILIYTRVDPAAYNYAYPVAEVAQVYKNGVSQPVQTPELTLDFPAFVVGKRCFVLRAAAQAGGEWVESEDSEEVCLGIDARRPDPVLVAFDRVDSGYRISWKQTDARIKQYRVLVNNTTAGGFRKIRSVNATGVGVGYEEKLTEAELFSLNPNADRVYLVVVADAIVAKPLITSRYPDPVEVVRASAAVPAALPPVTGIEVLNP